MTPMQEPRENNVPDVSYLNFLWQRLGRLFVFVKRNNVYVKGNVYV